MVERSGEREGRNPRVKEPKFTQPPPALARLIANTWDGEALGRLRADFQAAATPPAAELVAAAVNLVYRIADGTVAANASATRLLGEAWAGLGDVEQAHRLALVERLDACASGLGDEVPLEADEQGPFGAPEPPLLTIRADGSTVVPGSFELAPTPDPPSAPEPAPAPAADAVASAQTTTSAPAIGHIDELKAVAAGLEAACSQLAAQIGTLELVAGEKFERLASELSATSVAIDHQRRVLAEWLATNAPPPSGDAGD